MSAQSKRAAPPDREHGPRRSSSIAARLNYQSKQTARPHQAERRARAIEADKRVNRRFAHGNRLGKPITRWHLGGLDGDDPLRFVISANIARRHFNEAQRCMCATRLRRWRAGVRRKIYQMADL